MLDSATLGYDTNRTKESVRHKCDVTIMPINHNTGMILVSGQLVPKQDCITHKLLLFHFFLPGLCVQAGYSFKAFEHWLHVLLCQSSLWSATHPAGARYEVLVTQQLHFRYSSIPLLRHFRRVYIIVCLSTVL